MKMLSANCLIMLMDDKLKKLVKKLTKTLQITHRKIATAESCTGGLLASLLTEFPGSSVWFDRGFVTYSNFAKQDMLKVRSALLEQYGAVSIPVAEAMALGALQASAADITVAITGIAGPGGGSPEKPVGTVCFAWGRRDLPVKSLEDHFPNYSREEVRQLACCRALEQAILLLNQNEVL